MNRIIGFFIAVIFTLTVQAQTYQYRSAENPYYWHNRIPNPGYWQQDVQYKIKADLDDKTDIVTAFEELTYFNNSPDGLSFVYFHLYNNAQVKGSYLSDLYQNNNYKLKYGPYEAAGHGTDIQKISAEGKELKTETDNTIMKVWLPQPLKPGASITFSIDFKTYFDSGTIRNRMKMFKSSGYKHYDLVHWYPRISVYDRKLGWDTDQHMDHEFYGDYGTFDVEISFANNYILDATGILENRDEVLPKELREKIDVRNFEKKIWNSTPSEIIKPDGSKKTWKFHAVNVHDFALTADPTYRIGEAEWNGIKCYSICQEPHASGWQKAADYTAKLIQTYSETVGMYAYPKITVADAQDGMEYPMLTLDGGSYPDYLTLLAHEVGHNWFFGIVGNNETYRSGMDEGFTQFIESIAYEKINGSTIVTNQPASWYTREHRKPELSKNTLVYNGYIFDAAKGGDATLNTHSDGFNGAVRHGGGFSQNYFKTATMLYNLQYVLGDSLFLSAMKHYYNQWKICHPYFEDFKNSVINYTHVDLNWFFDEWWDTPKTIDYKIKNVKPTKEKDKYVITLERKGRMQMPVDFTVIANDDKHYHYYIPNTWFEKKTTATILPRWIGWDKVKPFYKAQVTIPGGIKDVRIDTTQRLADVNMLNNNLKTPVAYDWDHKIYNTPDWTSYEMFQRPDIWYNGYDGVKIGWHVNGNYLNYFHVFDANVWLNTGLGQGKLEPGAYKLKYDHISYRFNYRTATDGFIKKSAIIISGRHLDGLHNYSISFEKRDNANNKWWIQAKSLYRPDSNALNYLLLPGEWTPGKFNNTLTIGFEHPYNYPHGNGTINAALRSSALASDYDYSSITVNAINKNTFWKFNLNTRVFIQYGAGSNWASESSLFAAGANPEEMMENKFTRSQGFFSTDIASIGANTNNFHAGGGLNLRGYSGYLMPEKDAQDLLRYSYKGQSGTAINAELEFDRLFTFLFKPVPQKLRSAFKINTYLFADAGTINYNYTTEKKLLFGEIRADGGVGTSFTIRKWWVLQGIDPLTIRFDMPLFLNRPPAGDEDFFKFRWVIGVSRAF